MVSTVNRLGARDSKVLRMGVAATVSASTKSACSRQFPPRRKLLFLHMLPTHT